MRASAIILILIFLLFGGYTFRDLGEAIMYYGTSLHGSWLGIFAFLFIMVFIIFTDEILNIFKKIKRRVKLK